MSLFSNTACHIMFGVARERLWSSVGWQPLRSAIDRASESLGATPSLAVNDLLPGGSREAHPRQLGWTPEAEALWVRSPRHPERELWMLVDIQVCIPGRPIALRTHETPSIFLQVIPRRTLAESSAVYDHIVLCAIKDKAERLRQVAGALIHDLEQACQASLVAQRRKRITSMNEFESIVREDFMYRGMHLTAWPDLTKTKKKWSPRKVPPN